MNIIQTGLFDKKDFEGSVIITETSKNARSVTQTNSDIQMLYKGSNKHLNRFTRSKELREYVKVIKTKDFVDSYDNNIAVTIMDKNGNLQKIDEFAGIPIGLMRSLLAGSQDRPPRIPLHLELPYLIHYALNRHKFSSVIRKFVYASTNFGPNFDLWIVETHNLTWKLINVSIKPLALDVKYSSCDLTLASLEDFKCPEEFIPNIDTGWRYRISADPFNSFIGSSKIDFTSRETDQHRNPNNKINIRIINNWVQSECGKHVRAKLPGIIQQIISSCFMPLTLIDLIMDYTLIPPIDINKEMLNTSGNKEPDTRVPSVNNIQEWSGLPQLS